MKYDLDESRESFLKIGFALSAIEYSKIKNLSISMFGLQNIKLEDLKIGTVGVIVFVYLLVRWIIAVFQTITADTDDQTSDANIKRVIANVVKGRGARTVLEISALVFEVGTPILLTSWYIWMIVVRI